jgi:hypothetical protein
MTKVAPRKAATPKPAPVPVEETPQVLAALDDGFVTVETAGSFMLIDVITGAEIAHTGTTKVRWSPFIAEQLEAGTLKRA